MALTATVAVAGAVVAGAVIGAGTGAGAGAGRPGRAIGTSKSKADFTATGVVLGLLLNWGVGAMGVSIIGGGTVEGGVAPVDVEATGGGVAVVVVVVSCGGTSFLTGTSLSLLLVVLTLARLFARGLGGGMSNMSKADLCPAD